MFGINIAFSLVRQFYSTLHHKNNEAILTKI